MKENSIFIKVSGDQYRVIKRQACDRSVSVKQLILSALHEFFIRHPIDPNEDVFYGEYFSNEDQS